MGEEVTPRCWAQYGSDGALCERMHEPDMVHIHIGNSKKHKGDASWYNEHCANDAGPNGRKSAALRILEVSHELDRLAFLDGDSDEFVDMLRAIAARLYASASAAKQDHRDLVSFIKGTRQHLQESKADDAIRRAVTAIVELVELAADILQPFAS